MHDLDLAPVANPQARLGVPVIDLSAESGAVTEQVGRACAEWGFFQIVDHGVDPELMAAAMAQTRALFALPSDEKRALSRTRDNPWGYYDRELTKNARDKKEIFDIGPEATGAPGGDPFEGRTPWPRRPAGFEPVLRAYRAACEGVAARLVEAVSRSLGGGEGEMRRAFEGGNTSFLRLNHYPVEDPLGDADDGGAGLGIHHHTDAGALTMLLQDAVSGLQVYRDGIWYDVEPLAGAFVVNIGDMVQVWSNDLYPAALHRVRAMDRIERHSIPYFHNPGYDTVVAPLAAALRRSGAPRYSGIAWGAYRRRRADGDFADYGAEVQIADYRI